MATRYTRRQLCASGSPLVRIFVASLLPCLWCSAALGATAVGRIAGVYSVDPAGGANYSVPIDVSAGRGGLAPAISLDYNSHDGNGMAGVGFSLGGLSRIARCAQTLAVDGRVQGVRFDSRDRFCLDGRPLVVVAGTAGSDGTEYRTEVDGLRRIFTRGRSGSGPASFEILNGDGTTWRYGTASGSRIAAPGTGEIREWWLDTMADPFSNHVIFEYGGDPAGHEALPSGIRWTTDAAGAGGRFRLLFSWEERPVSDQRSVHQWGAHWRRDRRLSSIRYEFDSGSGFHLVHQYTLAYRNGASSTGRSLLASLEQCGPRQCLPPTTFAWKDGRTGFDYARNGPVDPGAEDAVFADHDGDGDADIYVPVTANGKKRWHVRRINGGSTNLFDTPPVNTGIERTGRGKAMDFDGDGRRDLLTWGPAAPYRWTVYLSNGAGGFLPGIDTGIPTSEAGFPIPFDINGDGLEDLLYVRDYFVRFRLNTGGQLGAEQSTTVGPSQPGSVPLLPLTHPTASSPDFDGDGRHDLLIARGTLALSGPPTYYEGYLSTGSDFVRIFTTPSASDALPLDLNGDGLSDLAYRDRALGWQTRLSLGNALMAPEATGIVTPPGTIVTALDFDADGRDDLLRKLSDSQWRIHFSGGAQAPFSNTDGSRYVDIADAPVPFETASLSSTDVTGDGLADLMMLDGSDRWRVRVHSGVRGDLLTRVTDGLGNVWQPSYTPLSRSASYRRNGTARPGEILILGGAFHVVSSTLTSDGAGRSYSTLYSYANGRYDRRGRGFLGFERVKVADLRYVSYHNVSVSTETTYSQMFPYTGLPELVTTTRGTAQTMRSVDPEYGTHRRTTAAGEPAGDYFFVHLATEKTDEYETDSSAGALGQLVRTTRRTLTVDPDHGVPVREDVSISAPGSAPVFNSATVTTLDNAARSQSYCLGLPLRRDETRDVSGAEAPTRSTTWSWSPATCREITRVEAATEPPSRQQLTLSTWNAGGQLVRVMRSSRDLSDGTRHTSYGYDAGSDNPRTESAHIANQPSHVIHRTWDDGLGVELERTDPRGLTTRFAVDDFGRPVSRAPAGGLSAAVEYLPCASSCFAPHAVYRIVTRRNDGHVSEEQRDAYGRSVGREFSLAGGHRSRATTEYDGLGRMRREVLPYVDGEPQFHVDYRYDIAGRKLSETRPADEAGSVAETRWTFAGLTRTVRDPANRVTTRGFDALGNLVSVSSASGGTATYGYTPFGELASITDANGAVTTLGYDGRGQLAVVTSPDSGRRTSTYNAFGELVLQTDARAPAGQIAMKYDALGRLIERRDSGTGVARWEFHTVAGPLLGLPRRVTSPVGNAETGFEERYAYDAFGRQSEVSTTMDGRTWTTGYAWDALGRVSRMTYPVTQNGDRMVLRYRYDSAGYTQAIDQDISGGLGAMWLQLYQLVEQDALARERHIRLGSYITVDERRHYDRATSRLHEVRTGAGDQANRQHLQYAWDKSGNLTARRDVRQGIAEEFDYDELDRLVGVRLNGNTTLTLAYDAAGRLLSKSDAGTYRYGSSHPNAVTTVSGGPRGTLDYGYDANGNMVSRNGRPITWTVHHQPLRIDDAGGRFSEFAYGPDRSRIRQVTQAGSGRQTTWYVGRHFEVDQLPSGPRFRSVVFANGEAVYLQVEDSIPAHFAGYFLHRDQQGSIETLTRFIGAGADSIAQRFDAHGKRRNPDWSADPADLRAGDEHLLERGYTGHEHLDAVRLIHMNGRVQDPVLGSMLSPDPVLGSILNPQSLNRYAYAANNPTSNVDPSGYLFGSIGKFFKRLVRKFGGFLRRAVRNYSRQIGAAIAGYFTAGYASAAYMAGAGPGASLAVGNTLGAFAGGAVAGGLSTGDLRGVASGGITGVAFGGIADAFGGEWTVGRVLTSGAVGGMIAKSSGGSFGRGFEFAAGGAALGYAYDRFVGYEATWQSGGPAQGKSSLTMPRDGVNNIGEASAVIDPNSLLGEGGHLSRFLNRVPGINAIAGMHDVFQVHLEQFGGNHFGGLLRGGLNYPGMPVAAALTYPALANGAPAVMMAGEE